MKRRANSEALGQRLDGHSPLDLARTSAPAEADAASLYPNIMGLAGTEEFPNSFLNPRFTDVAAYRLEGLKVLQAGLSYWSSAVALRAEVMNRQDLGEFTRDKVVFSTSAQFRVPAYVHIPKNRKGKLSAIVDLHSHGGMFIFCKEKVIDFGVNHPSLVEYHKANYEGRLTVTQLVWRGYVVITIDACPFGERRVMLDEDAKYGWERSKYSFENLRYLNGKCRAKEATIVKSLAYAE